MGALVLRKFLLFITVLVMVISICGCSDNSDENSTDSNTDTSLAVEDWKFTEMEWCDGLNVSMPPYVSDELHYGLMDYSCEWDNSQVELYCLPLTNYIYGGGGGGKDYDNISITSEDSAFDNGIWAFRMEFVDISEEGSSSTFSKSEVTTESFNDITVTKVSFSINDTDYVAYVHISINNNDDAMFIIEQDNVDMLNAIMETISID